MQPFVTRMLATHKPPTKLLFPGESVIGRRLSIQKVCSLSQCQSRVGPLLNSISANIGKSFAHSCGWSWRGVAPSLPKPSGRVTYVVCSVTILLVLSDMREVGCGQTYKFTVTTELRSSSGQSRPDQ